VSPNNLASEAFSNDDVDYVISVPGVHAGYSIVVRKSDGKHLNRWASSNDEDAPQRGLDMHFYATQDVIDSSTIHYE